MSKCFENVDDIGKFYGTKKFYNDDLMEAGPDGYVHTELIQKEMNSFTLKQGWSFPRKVYFNRDECVMPLLDSYPVLPNLAHENHRIAQTALHTILLSILLIIFSRN